MGVLVKPRPNPSLPEYIRNLTQAEHPGLSPITPEHQLSATVPRHHNPVTQDHKLLTAPPGAGNYPQPSERPSSIFHWWGTIPESEAPCVYPRPSIQTGAKRELSLPAQARLGKATV